MKDRLGNDLNVGDRVIAYSNMQTGSSTTRLVQYEGKVFRFTPTSVVVECVGCVYRKYIGDYFKPIYDNVFKIHSDSVGDVE